MRQVAIQSLHLLFIGILMILFTNVTYSQSNNQRYTLVHYNHESGLDQESISQIRVGNDGFLWIINNSGVLRFDGRQFKYIQLPKKNRMITFYENINGDSLYAMDSEDNYYSISNSRIKDTSLLYKRKYIKGTRRNVMFLTASEQKNVTNVYRTFEDKNNGIFIARNRSIYFHQLYTDTVYTIYKEEQKKYIVKNPSPGFRFLLRDTMYYLDNRGNWAVFQKGNLVNYNYPSGITLKNITAFDRIGKLKESMHGEYIYSNNRSAYFYYNKKLYEIINSKGIIDAKIICDDLPDIKDISGIAYHTQSNTYFISSFTQGLYSLQVSPFQVLQSNLNILYQNNIMGIMPLGDSSIITTRNVLFGKNNNASIGPFPEVMVYGIAKDLNQNLYVSFQEKNDYVIKRYSSITKKIEKIADGVHISITHSQTDTNGKLWISDFNSIYQVEDDGKKLIKKLAVPVTKSQEFSIYSFCLYTASTCYIGMTKYLLRWDIQTNNTDTILRNVFVRSISKDRSGYLWIGTYGGGYYVCKPNTSKPIKLPADRNGAMDYVHNFNEDSLGYMWSGTNNGLFRYRKKDIYSYIEDSSTQIHYTRFDVISGLSTNEFNGGASPSSIRDASGNLLLASMNGIVKFRPEKVEPINNSLPIYVESVIVDDSSYEDISSLHFPSTTKNIKFIITSSLIGIGKNNWYQYQLEGNSATWDNIQENGEIILNGLKNGKFVLVVRKETNQGFTYLRIPFDLAPPFYLSSKFIGIAILLFFIIAYSFYKYRLTSLERKKKELERIINEKTNHLNLVIDELTSSNHIIERATSIVLHDLRTPLKFITSISGSLFKKNKKSLDTELKTSLSTLYVASSEVFQFSNNLLIWLSNNKKETKIDLSIIDLKTVLDEILEVYAVIITNSGNEFYPKVPKDLYCYSNSALIAIVIRNALDNANKYTHNGVIKLEAFKYEDKLKIFVIDSGKGFDVAIINEKIKQAGENHSSSLGIHIIHDICEKISASYHFKSNPEEGTVFTLEIPIQKKI